MKKQVLLGIQALFASALFFFNCSSSSDEIETPLPQEEEKFIQVPIGFSGEILNITDSPLSRTNDAKDWYAFQVYSAPQDGSQEYSYYAYGFFDNKENMIINLKEGYKYKFDVCMVVDGSEKVEYFSLVNAGWASIGNSFYISSEEHVRYMYEGYLYIQNPRDTYDRPNVDRFFGRTTDYIPSEGGNVEINMKRVSFGAKFVAKEFNEGSLEISVEGAPIINLSSSEGNEIQEIISFNNLEGALTNNDYSESIPVNITWVKTDNVRVPIASEAVSFKRNRLTTIEFTVKESTSSSSFNLNADETMEDGDTLEIGGDGTNTEIDPNN
jgi:hypothetical protein